MQHETISKYDASQLELLHPKITCTSTIFVAESWRVLGMDPKVLTDRISESLRTVFVFWIPLAKVIPLGYKPTYLDALAIPIREFLFVDHI